MIEIKHLKKTYISKDKSKSRGLVDVSFTLPSSGFVFVLGKSGSGKSTLLNRLGTLDEPTSGEILVDGKDISCFTDEERSYYRSSYCGFVFQDYQLINELTVRENVMLSLDIVSDTKDKKERADRALKEMGLFDYGDKYPNELSGGQKQRVSIARALVKNPKLVLCDEPTGNLDKRTSKAILDRLKERSKTCLVFMVSHDPEASLAYADRRIRLQDGLVINDERRKEGYKNQAHIKDGVFYLPYQKELTVEERNRAKKGISDGSIKTLGQIGNGFEETGDRKVTSEKFRPEKKEIDAKAKRKLTKIYTLKGKGKTIGYSILFALLSVMLVLIQTFLVFDSSKIVSDNIDKNQDAVVLSSFYQDGSTPGNNNLNYKEANKETEDKIFYNGKATHYPIINHTIVCAENGLSFAQECGLRRGRDNTILNSNGFYPLQTLGTAIVDDDYLSRRFGDENGKLTILAGSLDNCRTGYSLIITDYIADAITDTFSKFAYYKDYQHRIGPRKHLYDISRIFGGYNSQIGCIIKTDYKEKYKTVLEKYNELKNKKPTKNEITQFQYSDDFVNYFNDIVTGELTLDFTLNQNFYQDIKDKKGLLSQAIPLGGFSLSTTNKLEDEVIKYSFTDIITIGNNEKENEVNIPPHLYQTLSLYYPDQKVIGKEIYRLKREGNEAGGNVSGAVKRKICNTNDYSTRVSKDIAKEILAIQTREIGYLVPCNAAGFSDCLSEASSRGFLVWDKNLNVYRLIGKTLNLFTNIFSIIEYTLVVVRVVLLILVGNENIKKNKYQIGVRKSLGRKKQDIKTIFRTKNILFEIGSIILALILLPLFFLLANRLLVHAYSSFLSISIEKRTVFYFHPFIILIDILGVCLFFLIVALIPFIKREKIMPAKIVNNKDE